MCSEEEKRTLIAMMTKMTPIDKDAWGKTLADAVAVRNEALKDFQAAEEALNSTLLAVMVSRNSNDSYAYGCSSTVNVVDEQLLKARRKALDEHAAAFPVLQRADDDVFQAVIFVAMDAAKTAFDGSFESSAIAAMKVVKASFPADKVKDAAQILLTLVLGVEVKGEDKKDDSASSATSAISSTSATSESSSISATSATSESSSISAISSTSESSAISESSLTSATSATYESSLTSATYDPPSTSSSAPVTAASSS